MYDGLRYGTLSLLRLYLLVYVAVVQYLIDYLFNIPLAEESLIVCYGFLCSYLFIIIYNYILNLNYFYHFNVNKLIDEFMWLIGETFFKKKNY